MRTWRKNRGMQTEGSRAMRSEKLGQRTEREREGPVGNMRTGRERERVGDRGKEEEREKRTE